VPTSYPEENWVLTDDIRRGWAHRQKLIEQRLVRKRVVFGLLFAAAGILVSIVLGRVGWGH
jgi:hypothetical protein